MKLKQTITTAMIGFLFVMPTNANAWWPIMHYSIAKYEMIGQLTNPAYANMPDVWPVGNISNEFFFSHGAVDTGGILIPNKPEYPHDGRYPELLMTEFSKKTSRDLTAEDKDMILGYAAHNAMDNNVHWAFFGGGSITDWRDEHLRKEEWADYYAYMFYVCNVTPVADTVTPNNYQDGVIYGFMFANDADQNKVFGSSGNALIPINDLDVQIPTASAWLLSMAQKALRKSGYNIAKDGARKFEVSQDEAQIANIITTCNNTKFGDGLKGITDPSNNGTVQDWFSWDVSGGSWGSIKLARFEQLRLMASKHKWTIQQVALERARSVTRATEWVTFIKGQLK